MSILINFKQIGRRSLSLNCVTFAHPFIQIDLKRVCKTQYKLCNRFSQKVAESKTQLNLTNIEFRYNRKFIFIRKTKFILMHTTLLNICNFLQCFLINFRLYTPYY